MKHTFSLLLTLLLGAQVQAGLPEWQAAVSADAPRNWYRFDETSGTTLVDHGSGGFNGEYVEVNIGQPGLFGSGQAADFFGLPDFNDLVQFPDTWADATIAGDWSAEFVLNKTVEGISQALFNGPSTSVRLEQWNSFAVYGDYRGGVTQYGVADYYLEGTVANPGEWSHMVFVRSGGQTLIYLNGVLHGAMDNVVDLQMQTISRSNTSGEADKLHALLDEAVVYDKALTADQVATHFLATGIATEAVAPTISSQPQSVSVVLGTPDATATFSVVAAGSLPLQFQWQRDGVAIDGATGESLTLSGVSTADTGAYTVVITNPGGSVTSDTATLAIVAPPFNEGVGQTVLNGFPATFSVTLPDVEGYSFAWTKDGEPVAGATGPTLSIPSATPADSGEYALSIALGTDTVQVPSARLIVPATPTQSYRDTVVADGPVSYWRLGEPVGDNVMADVRGTFIGEYFTEVDLRVPGALLGDSDTAAAFRGAVESKAEVASDAGLNADRFTVELWAMRTGGAGTFTSPITQRDLTDTYRKGWTFYATDSNLWQFRIGDGTLNWVVLNGPAVTDGEWTQLVGTYDGTRMAFYVNGAQVGEVEASYVPVNPAELPPLLRLAGGSTEDLNGSFFFIGRLDEVAVYSSALTAEQVAAHYAAAFSPSVSPVIELQPGSTDILQGGTATLSVAVRTGTPVSYQWSKDGAALPGATEADLVVSESGTYTVAITNGAGTTTSAPATVAVVGPEATYEDTILRDGPVAYWRLDEADGTVAADSVGNFDGEYLNGVTLGQPGALAGDDNTAAAFTQASASRVEVPWAAELNTPEFTFECWAKVTGGTSYRSPITSRGDGPQEGFIFYATPGNAWEFWTGPGWNSVGGAAVVNDEWVYLAGTFDGTVKRFFVNGEQVGSGQPSFTPNDADLLRIGGGATESPDGNYFFEGLIDEVAVYNKALSPARIRTHYLAGAPQPEEIVMSISQADGKVVLTWSGSGVLEASPALPGNWSEVAGATSPHEVTPDTAATFWRVRNP